MPKILETVKKYLLYSLVVLYPVFVLSYSSTSFVVPKEILLGVLGGLAIIAWIAESAAKKSFTFKVGKFDLIVLLITAVYVLSAILQTPNKMEAFFYPGTVTLVAAGAIIYFLVNQLESSAKDSLLLSFVISGVALSVISLFAQLGVLAKIPQLPAFVKDVGFDPMGGDIPSVIYLLVALAAAGVSLFKQKEVAYKLFVGVSASIMLLGLIVVGKNAIPGGSQSASLPDFNTSWQVALDTIKEAPFLGVGSSNYLTAFNELRPVTYNSTSLWQIRFTTAADFYLTALTELGLAGLVVFGMLIFMVYKAVVKKFDIKYIPLIILLVLFAVLPAVQTLIVVLFITLALSSGSEDKSLTPFGSSPAGSTIVLVALPIFIALAVFYYFGFKVVGAEKTFAASLDALAANNAQATYNGMTSAVAQNPNVDRYHAGLAQLDMALATSIASKKTVTDADKNTISQLVQQAISEGKAAIVLNPQRSGNWQVLAQIYATIMPFATGADQFAIQTYSQAVALDPTDPNLRISLGGVYYALGRYSDAIDSFKLAVLAKPNLANAHYNLSVAYAAQKDYDDAITEMNSVISLVPKNSQDSAFAESALTNLQKQKPAVTTAPAATTSTANPAQALTAPQPEAKSNIKPPLTLPKEATPPASVTQ